MSVLDFGSIISMLSQIAAFCVATWQVIIQATQSGVFYISCVAVYCAVRFLLMPLSPGNAGAGSDSVRKKPSKTTQFNGLRVRRK